MVANEGTSGSIFPALLAVTVGEVDILITQKLVTGHYKMFFSLSIQFLTVDFPKWVEGDIILCDN